jgi:hypothetical protein
VTLLSIDEARRVVIASAGAVLAYAACPDTRRLEEVLWGREDFEGESMPDQALARAHRRVLAHVEALGYGAELAEELEGVCSAAGLEDGRRDYDFVFEVLSDEPLDFAGAEAFWAWPFAA